MSDRRYPPFDAWESIDPKELISPQLRHAAEKGRRDMVAFRIQASVAEDEQALELLWFAHTGRAGVASMDTVDWLNAETPEAALQAWALRSPSVQRSR